MTTNPNYELSIGAERVAATIPQWGRYSGTRAAWDAWTAAGRPVILARIADVHEGSDYESAELAVLDSAPDVVLAAMCAEWSPDESAAWISGSLAEHVARYAAVAGRRTIAEPVGPSTAHKLAEHVTRGDRIVLTRRNVLTATDEPVTVLVKASWVDIDRVLITSTTGRVDAVPVGSHVEIAPEPEPEPDHVSAMLVAEFPDEYAMPEPEPACIVVPNVDGPTLWDCPCRECSAIVAQWHRANPNG